MADQSVEEILASAAADGEWQKAQEFVGQSVTIIEYEVFEGVNGEYLVIDIVTEDGEEAKVSNGGKLAAQVQALRAGGKLPIELRMVGKKTQHGTWSCWLEVAEDE